MKFRTIITFIAIAVATVSVCAQKPMTAHEKAHQIAKVSKMDGNTLSNMVSTDVNAREAANAISSKTSSMIDDLLSEAKKYIGTPYVHGAKGPRAFDCSGYTSFIYKQFGYNISPGSRIQYTQGEPVARKDLRKGDLVFFTSRSSGKNVGHVGIVYSVDKVTGDFTFIHASLKGVKISPFSGYYVPRYVGAKRIIK